VASPLYKISPHYLVNSTVFDKKLLSTKCVFWFSLQLLSETFLILKRNEWDMNKNIYCFHVKNSSFFSDFNDTFLDRFSKNPQISNFENLSSGSQAVACRQTDMMKLTSSILTTLVKAKRTSVTNTYRMYTVLRYSWWTVDLSETCRVFYQINLRNCASHWLLL